MKRRLLCLLLTLTMVLLCIPAGIFAEGEEETINEEVQAEQAVAEVTAEENDAEQSSTEESASEEPTVEQTEEQTTTEETTVEQTEEQTTTEETVVEQTEEQTTTEETATEQTEEQTTTEETADGQTEEQTTTEETVVEQTEEQSQADKTVTEEEAVEEKTPIFEIDDDVLVKYNGEEEEVIVPDEIRVIGLRAFSENKIIKKVILPDSVEIIKNYAFEECSNLEEVVIGEESKLKTIGKGAFKNDKKLNVSFATSKEGISIVETAFDGIPVADEYDQDSIVTEEIIAANEVDDEVIIDAANAIAISNPPTNAQGNVGDTVQFTVSATGVKSWQWQYSVSGTGSWKACGDEGATTDTMTLSNITATVKKLYFRCKLTASDGTIEYTNVVKIEDKAIVEFSITAPPTNAQGNVGDTVQFTVGTTGVKGWQWQYSTSGTGSWKACGDEGATTDTMTLSNITASVKKLYFRCKLTTIDGATEYTNVVKIDDKVVITITVPPTNAQGNVGDTVQFTVSATGVKSWQWQYSATGTGSWKNCGDEGATTDTMILSNISASVKKLHFRCILTAADGTVEYTNVVVIEDLPVIIEEGVTYSIIEGTNNVCVVSYEGTQTTLTIPSQVRGHIVTEIGEEAFMGKNIVSISLPNSITIIHARAFKDCSNLSTMTNHD